jgi:DNA-binding protein H-NS
MNPQETKMAGKATVDLDKLSLDELKMLSKDIEKAITKKEADHVRKAREAVEAIAKQYGLSLHELIGGTSKKNTPASSGAAKFRNPDANDQTWSGRGRQPQWFKNAIASGRSADELAL